ncbi:hypothetical protein Y032_0053g2430 [Ancylostoma ceylanicum]|nr:hypothetical protein Y032_0053g2430 [Ancylostoma ceylanicum]
MAVQRHPNSGGGQHGRLRLDWTPTERAFVTSVVSDVLYLLYFKSACREGQGSVDTSSLRARRIFSVFSLLLFFSARCI